MVVDKAERVALESARIGESWPFKRETGAHSYMRFGQAQVKHVQICLAKFTVLHYRLLSSHCLACLHRSDHCRKGRIGRQSILEHQNEVCNHRSVSLLQASPCILPVSSDRAAMIQEGETAYIDIRNMRYKLLVIQSGVTDTIRMSKPRWGSIVRFPHQTSFFQVLY